MLLRMSALLGPLRCTTGAGSRGAAFAAAGSAAAPPCAGAASPHFGLRRCGGSSPLSPLAPLPGAGVGSESDTEIATK